MGFVFATVLHAGGMSIGDVAHAHGAAAGVAHPGDATGDPAPSGDSCAASGGCSLCVPVATSAPLAPKLAEHPVPVAADLRPGTGTLPALHPPRLFQDV